MRNLAIHKQCGAFILTRSFTSDVTYFFISSTWDILYPGMEGAFEVEMSCFGVTLYQYTASIIEHYFLVAILLMLQWYLFTIYEWWAMFNTTMTNRHTVILPTPTLVLGLYIGMLHIQWPLPKLTKTTVHQNYVLDFTDTEPFISCLERRMVLTSHWSWSPFPGILKKCSLLYSISIITLSTACVQVWLDTSSLLQTD